MWFTNYYVIWHLELLRGHQLKKTPCTILQANFSYVWHLFLFNIFTRPRLFLFNFLFQDQDFFNKPKLFDDPQMIFQYFPVFARKFFYSYIWSGLWWSTTWLRLLHSLETWRGEKAWEEERCKSQKYSQVEDYELLREVEINVLDIEHRTCSISLQDGGVSHWPAWCYEWTRGAIV